MVLLSRATPSSPQGGAEKTAKFCSSNGLTPVIHKPLLEATSRVLARCAVRS